VIVVNDRRVEWREGMTVRGVLDEMGYDFPLITVTVDGEFVPADDYETRAVPDGADVRVIHLHHGG